MSEYIVRMPRSMPYEIKAELNAWYVNSEPIVRCRDCRYLDAIRTSYSTEPDFQCMADWCQGVEGDSPFVEPDGYCAWGERRDG